MMMTMMIGLWGGEGGGASELESESKFCTTPHFVGRVTVRVFQFRNFAPTPKPSGPQGGTWLKSQRSVNLIYSHSLDVQRRKNKSFL